MRTFPPLQERLLSRIVREDNGCWRFTGGRTGSGYGAIGDKGKTLSAHVVSYELHKGPTNGLFVLHTCDNKMCVNPDHLWLGTLVDNKKDEIAKGRHVRGERQGQSKLTEANVRHIKRLLDKGHKKLALAKRFGVSDNAIRYIEVGRNWGWVS